MGIAGALMLTALAALPALYARDSLADKRQRAAYFESALPLFQSYRVTQAGKSWPVLTGRYRGHDVRLEPVQDDMAWRKVPSLWLKVTVLTPNPSRGTFGFLARPRGGEFYSPTPEMKHRLAIPAGWPADGLFCSDEMETAPPLDALTPEMALFQDPRMKEMVLTPRGVRLVHQAAQGERAHYLVLRQASFPGARADAQQLRLLLDRAIAIAEIADTCEAPPQPVAA